MGAMHFEVDIARAADGVWAYLADPSHEADWQDGVVSSWYEPTGAIGVGTLKHKVRRTPFVKQSFR